MTPFQPPVAPAMPSMRSGNPVLDEIHAAHATLSSSAKQALEQAHGMLGSPGMPPMIGAPAPASPGDPGGEGAPLSPIAAPGLQVRPITPTPAMNQNTSELNRLQSSPSGISGMRHAAGRVPLQILDAIGGGLFPGIEQRLPGTQGHHDVLVRQAERNVTGDTAQLDAEAKRQQETATAVEQASLPEYHGQVAENARQRTEMQGQIGNERAATQAEHERGVQAENAAKDAARKAQEERDLLKAGWEKDENGKLQPIPLERQSPAAQAAYLLVEAKTNREDAIAELRKAQATNQPLLIANAQAKLEQASRAHDVAEQNYHLHVQQQEMRAHGTENGVPLPGAVATPDNQSVGTAFQGNVKPSEAARNRAATAGNVLDAGEELKRSIDQHKDKLGNLGSYWNQFINNTPIADPEVANIMAQLESYIALQPGMHGFRGGSALAAFAKATGGIPKGAEALKAAIDGFAKTAGVVQKSGTVPTVKPQGGGRIQARDPQGKLHDAPVGTPLPAGWTEEKPKAK